jgi:membrane protease YdiL (CAAX protease family)
VNDASSLIAEAIRFFNAFGFPLALGATAGLLFWWSGRIYTRYRDSGHERMGLYLSAAIQSWSMLLLITAPYWLVGVVLKGYPIERYLAELSLLAPASPEIMINWSAGLLLAMAAVAWIASAIQEALKIQPTRVRLLLQPTTTAETATWSLLVSPTAGICEEILFRSMLVPFAIREFGVVHFTQGLTGILATAAMGAILAMGLIFTGSVWPSIVAHALYNMAVPFLFRIDEAEPEPAAGT